MTTAEKVKPQQDSHGPRFSVISYLSIKKITKRQMSLMEINAE